MSKSIEIKKEIAEKTNKSLNGKIWSKGECVRIYLRKGYVSIEKDDGSVNIDNVGGNCYRDVKDSLDSAGIRHYRA